MYNADTRISFVPFPPSSVRRSFCFDPDPPNDPTPQGGTGIATVDDPPPAPAPAPPPAPRASATVPRSELTKVVKQRDEAKRQLAALTRALSINLDDVEFRETDDPNNPFEVEGIDEVREALQRAAEGDDPEKRKAQAQATRARIEKPLMKRAQAAEKQRDALLEHVRQVEIRQPLRLAAQQLGAIDDDNGQYNDLVTLLEKRFTVSVDFDAESGKPVISRTAKGDDDEPIDDETKSTPHAVMSAYLDSRPKYRQSTYRPGPGAGGVRTPAPPAANGNGAHARTPIVPTTPRGPAQAASQFFGNKRPPAM